MKIKFVNIPVESKFAVFNLEDKSSTMVFNIEAGNSEINIEIPDDWDSPHRNFRSLNYYIPNQYIAIDKTNTVIEITGNDFFIDVNRETMNEELNQKSIETLIHTIFSNDSIDGRQKFFISLVSLQSYFEHLIYGMLVLSSHLSKSQFKNINSHPRRTDIAFSNENTDFFSNEIKICPGKENLGITIQSQVRTEFKNIFDEIRTLRNSVVHKWGYKDISQQELKDTFNRIGEQIDLNDSHDDFLTQAAFIFVRLYARVNPLNNQLSYFNEKEIVREERATRGY